MAPSKGKSKSRGKPAPVEQTLEQDDDLAMSEEEMYRIIRDTGVMGESASSESFVTMRPSELPTQRFEELEQDSGENDEYGNDDEATLEEEPVASASSSSDIPQTTRKLVELIDEDEALPLPDLSRINEGNVPLTLSSIEEDETFKIILWMVVFSTLWLCLDLAIHAQYGQDRGFTEELSRAINVLPALGFVIYFTAKYPDSLLTRIFLFSWSAIGGSYMIYIVNRAGYLQVMRRCPILGSIWIWAIVQLDLPSALISLAAVVGYVKYNGLNVIFPS